MLKTPFSLLQLALNMKIVLILNFTILLNIHFISGQNVLKINKKHISIYGKDEKNYFDPWLADIRIQEKFILEHVNSVIPLDISNIKNAYWNRFITYYKIGTPTPPDILYPFFDALKHDKDDFCKAYDNIFNSKEKSVRAAGNRENFYKEQLVIMDNVCSCVLKSYNKILVNKLIKLKENDQLYRNKIPYDLQSQTKLDSINLKEALEIFDNYGYPNRNLVGIELEDIFFYIILHSDLNTMTKFLSIIHDQVKKGLLRPDLYPLLHDRISVFNNEPQIFGTQSIFDKSTKQNVLYKTINKKDLNQNRRDYCLKPIE